MKPAIALLISACLLACSSGTNSGPGGGSGGGTAGGSAGGGSGGGGVGGGGGGTGGGGQTLVPLSSFCGVAAIKSCDHLKTCKQLDAAQMADCRAKFEARCSAKARGTDAGTLRYDAVEATNCVASSYNPPCYGGPEDLYDCLDTVFQFAGRIGAPCEAIECIEGYCPQGVGANSSCRACTAYFAQGQPCTQPNSCNPSVGFCPLVSTDGGATVCEPLRGPGGECQTGLECAGRASCVNFQPLDGGIPRCGPIALGNPCVSPGDCGVGSYCKGLRIAADATITPGTCASRIALNSPCTNEQYDDGCQGAGATCLGLKCITAQPHARPLSAECDAYDQCPVGAYCTCAGPLTEDGGISVRDGNCLSQQGNNGMCWEEEEYSMCLPGLDCLSHGLCAPLRTESQTCGPGIGKCLSFLNCTQELTGTATCVAARQPGQSCADITLPCAPNSFCLADAGAILGVCKSSLATGATCASGFECQSARCLDVDAGKACGASCF